MDSFSFSRMRSFLPTTTRLPEMPSLSDFMPQLSGTQTPPIDATNGGAADTQGETQFLEPRPIDDSKPKTNLDLISECDSFPYLHAAPERFFQHVNHYYHLQVRSFPGLCLGYVLPSVVAIFKNLEGWDVNEEDRTLVLEGGDSVEERSAIVANTFAAMRQLDHFKILKKWRSELYTVHGPRREVLFTVERAASALLGVVTYGAHLTAFVREKPEQAKAKDDDAEKRASESGVAISAREEHEQLKIWVPRRARTKDTYGGMLDNTVAGGMSAGEHPFECLIREAEEEASLPSEVLLSRCRAAGTVSYFHIRDHRAGGETGLLQPECQYVYDLDLTGLDVQPKPEDGEVDEFLFLTVEETQAALLRGEFKPNTALVLLDFFVRHGILTAENEPDYAEITSRLHRVTDFPTR